MTAQDISKTFFQRLWNDRDFDVAYEIVDEDCITHQLNSDLQPIGSAPRDPDSLIEHVQSWIEGFPDIRADVETSLTDGDRVVSWVVMRGTHRGSWLGIAPTNRKVAIRTVVMHRIAKGKIVEDWVLTERYGFLEQLGVLPPVADVIQRATRNR